jgi:ribosomal protein S18 acetylase RimI-like enzyme
MASIQPESKRTGRLSGGSARPDPDRGKRPGEIAPQLCHPGRVLHLHLRPAGIGDLAAVLPRTLALNAHEGIAVDPPVLEAALDRLLRDPALGGVWLVERSETGGEDPDGSAGGAAGSAPRGIERDGAAIGYAMVTFGYDLEFGGRDAFLTELWIDPPARGTGAGSAALALLDPELRARGVRALHLQVRPDNPALRLYQRSGFIASPRIVMTRRL